MFSFRLQSSISPKQKILLPRNISTGIIATHARYYNTFLIILHLPKKDSKATFAPHTFMQGKGSLKSIFEQAPAASARSVSALRTALRCRFLRSFFLQVFFVRALSEESYNQVQNNDTDWKTDQCILNKSGNYISNAGNNCNGCRIR